MFQMLRIKHLLLPLIIDAATFKAYGNSISVNGTARTLRYSVVPDLSILTVGAGKCIMQQISIIMTASTTVPFTVISNVSSFY